MTYLILTIVYINFFFFQAEDGIRDADVTGVQTCALPIFGQACAQRVSTCNDHTVVNTQLQERVANCVDLGQEVGVRNSYFTVLVTALLLVRNLVFDLDTASTSFDHLLGQQIGGLFVTETSVDVGNDGYNVSFEVVDLVQDFLLFGFVASFAGFVQFGEQQVQLTGISLTQEGVELFDQAGNCSLLVHGLVGQRTELGAQSSNHPAGEVQVLLVGSLQVLLDGNHLLLANEAVPAAQRLSVQGRIGIVLSHVFTHDGCSVLGDVQTGLEAVLQTHARSILRINRMPGFAVFLFQSGNSLDLFLILRHDV